MATFGFPPKRWLAPITTTSLYQSPTKRHFGYGQVAWPEIKVPDLDFHQFYSARAGNCWTLQEINPDDRQKSLIPQAFRSLDVVQGVLHVQLNASPRTFLTALLFQPRLVTDGFDYHFWPVLI